MKENTKSFTSGCVLNVPGKIDPTLTQEQHCQITHAAEACIQTHPTEGYALTSYNAGACLFADYNEDEYVEALLEEINPLTKKENMT